MNNWLSRIWREDDGVLSFEWILLSSMLAVGVISGIAGTREALLAEFIDVTEAISALDQSYRIEPPATFEISNLGPSGGSGSLYVDQSQLVDSNRLLDSEDAINLDAVDTEGEI